MRARAAGGAALGLLACLSACASAGDVLAGGRAPACYRFERDPSPGVNLPWGVELRADSLVGWGNLPDAHVARTLTSATEATDHPLAYWRRVAGDSVRVGHPGSGALTLTLAPVEGGLAGRAESRGDAVVPGADATPGQGTVSAVRVACEVQGG